MKINEIDQWDHWISKVFIINEHDNWWSHQNNMWWKCMMTVDGMINMMHIASPPPPPPRGFSKCQCAIGGSSSLPLRCHGCRFTWNHCACAPILYISGLSEGCTVSNEIDYAWTSIHDNGQGVTASDVILLYRSDI